MGLPDRQVATLPTLRPDIEFYLGPDDPDGSPTYVIHDPLAGTFERATWAQAEILRRLRTPMTMERLLAQLSGQSTVKVSAEDVLRLCADAASRGLTMDSLVASEDSRARPVMGGPALMMDSPVPTEHSMGKGTGTAPNTARSRSCGTGFKPVTWFGRLAYLRLPLFRPDAFLERTLGLVRPLASPAARIAYACVTLVGLVLLAQRLDAYLATFPYFFNPAGAVAFALTVAGVKAIHEFSHAYVAKALGVRVPAMGLTLIFLFPVPYSDVTDAWRLPSRRKRALIALAGVLAELVIAGFALVVWALTGPGLVRSICFVVSSATLLSTLLVNLKPATRFDGYYILSDLLGIDNLQSRSMALARWVLRRWLLALPIPTPEPGLTRRRAGLMLAYAVYAWTYRLALYAGIALVLYHRFTKVIGAMLFGAAVYTFIIRPVLSEVTMIWRMRRLLSWNVRTVLTAAATGAALLWAAVPWPRWAAVPATTTPRERQVIYAPGSGVLRELKVGLGTPVCKGQTLFVLESEELEDQASLARLEIRRLNLEMGLIKSHERQRPLLPQKTEELARAEARLESVLAAIDGNRCVAAVDGVVVEWDDSVREGTHIGPEQVLGLIIDQHQPTVVCYVPHNLVQDVAAGDPVYFCRDDRPARLRGRVTFVDPVRTALLEHRGLASVAGGDIPVTPDSQGRLRVVETYYRVEVALDDHRATGFIPRGWSAPPEGCGSLRLGQTGRVWLRGAARSRLADLLRRCRQVLVRESGF
jgi:putative peptide zinc metalloprotease protein